MVHLENMGDRTAMVKSAAITRDSVVLAAEIEKCS